MENKLMATKGKREERINLELKMDICILLYIK